ncbi:hypothetical protein [Sphingobium sp.]|uniref:hypothetical protein n=1 Tax=Sphingobium sp. TaxID=1912891 RepID=UPI002611B909|nr:hypothetical protein [Sphingobium sp.]
MPKRAQIVISALLAPMSLCMAMPVHAADVESATEAWTPTQSAIRANAAGISLPQTVAGLSLAKSGEASSGGRAVDNYAQYLSEDGAIQATLYVYMPTYADASLAAYMTDKAIMERFGSQTRRTAYASAPAAGQAGRAIRAVYDHAADGALVTAAGFVHAGRWIAKIRITGPSDRRAEVLAGLDGMLSGLAFDDAASLHATAPAAFSACPAAETGDARLEKAEPATPSAPLDVRIPREGKDALCVRGAVTTADGRYDMLQQAGRSDGPIIVPVDDSGTVLAFDPSAGQGNDRGGYKLSIHMVGQTDLYGTYDKVPSPRQIAAIIDGKDAQTAQAQSVATYAANGDVTMEAVQGH